MTFYEWIETNEAKDFISRIEAGEKGNPDNPRIAAWMAYEAGIREGISRAANKISKFLNDA